MSEEKEKARERTKEIAAAFRERGDPLGWFDALYSESAGDPSKIPWADLEPNKYFKVWADKTKLRGDGRTALVVGCGLGDDANLLSRLGFKVTAFDISATAVKWAKKLYAEANIDFRTADLFHPPPEWIGAFDFVLEIYTIQPLPIEMRPQVIDAIAEFVKPGGKLVVVTRGRDDDDQPDELPWPVSRLDLTRFVEHDLLEMAFTVLPSFEEDEPDRFIVEYERVK
jgi:SAM-dependent methyltransferase